MRVPARSVTADLAIGVHLLTGELKSLLQTPALKLRGLETFFRRLETFFRQLKRFLKSTGNSKY